MAAGGLVFNEKNELLMIFRRGKWDLPKGKTEANETPEMSAIREVQEETGLQNLSIRYFSGITHHEYFDPYIHEQVLKETQWFVMSATINEKLIPQTEEDITAIKWADDTDLIDMLKNTYPNIRQIITLEKESHHKDL